MKLRPWQLGAPELMHQTFVEQIFSLADDVRVFPGHDYIEDNLEFTLGREPDNQSAQSLRSEFQAGLSAESYVSTIGLEREMNVFFRLDQSAFVGLRRLRDEW